jgi:hypothetical protein
MAKPVSPLLGFNNNVRHKNRVFHIQTEDSGIKHPHIITHLFMDGGRILKSVKKSYAEHVGTDDMQNTVRAMMKEQHKQMFIALRDGQFDAVVDEQVAAKAKYDANAPPAKGPKDEPKKEAQPESEKPDTKRASGAPPPEKAPSVRPVADTIQKAPSVRPPSVRPPSVRPVADTVAEKAPSVRPGSKVPSVRPPADTVAEIAAAKPESKRPGPQRTVTQAGFAMPMIPQRPPAPTLEDAAPRAAAPPPPSATATEQGRTFTPGGRHRLVVLPEADEQPPTTTRDPDRVQPPPSIDIDLEGTPQPPPPSQPNPALFRANDLPPPPQNLFRKREITHATSYRAKADSVDDFSERAPDSSGPKSQPNTKRSQPPAAAAARPQQPPAQQQPPQQQRASAGSTPGSAPPGRYAPARPASIFGQQRGKSSLFGEDLVTDKSLDEVILSYLAEDLESAPKKK